MRSLFANRERPARTNFTVIHFALFNKLTIDFLQHKNEIILVTCGQAILMTTTTPVEFGTLFSTQ